MRKILFLTAILFIAVSVSAQSTNKGSGDNTQKHEYKIEDGKVSVVKAEKKTPDNVNDPKLLTRWVKDGKEMSYELKEGLTPIYITKNNKLFVLRTSKKTGNVYRQYLSDLIP